ncbi:MAG TPA: MFS transporter, partial [Actinomycetota bacterium]|nr:MFS transporter [Actinomycetota bacterium]
MIRDTLEDTDITSSIDLDPAALPRVDLGEDTLQLDGEGTPGDPSVIDLREEPEKLGRDYQKLWLATAVTNLGDGVRVAALPLLAATLTRDPLFISGVLFASKLPWLLFSLHSGAIVDRVDRRSLIVRVNLLRALVMGIFGITLATGSGSLWLLYSIALLQGIGEVFSDNASFALMPKLVPRTRLEAANGRLEAAIVVFNGFAGPALGSLLFVAATAAPFALDASTFLVSALVMLSIAPAAK